MNQAKAIALQKAGAEVVKFDMDDASTHGPALQGAYGVFAVTNYWEHLSTEKEKAQAKSIADAAKAAGVKHIIWSTLEGTNAFFDSLPESERPNKLGKYYVPHFDAKHESNAYFPPHITTKLYASFYLENFITFGMVKDGVLCINMGDSPLPVIAADDIGKCAYEIFKEGHKYMGKNVYIAGDVMTCDDLMEVARDVTGKEFEYQPVDRETYASFDFPGADDLANMFYFYVKSKEYVKNRDHKAGGPKLQSAQDWFKRNAEAMSELAKPGMEFAPESAHSSSHEKETARKLTPMLPEGDMPYQGEDMWC